MVLLRTAAFAPAFSGCTPPAAIPPPPAKVVATSPLRTPVVEWDEFVGRVDAIEEVEVRARVGGHLASTHFEEGQIVQEGDLLCVLDQRPFQIAVEQAEAELAAAEASVDEAVARQAQSDAEIRSAQSQVELTEQMIVRAKGLLPQRAISQEEVDVRESGFKQAKADLDVRQAHNASSKAAITTARANLRSAQSRLATAQLNLEYTEVRAPVSGRVGHRAVTDGNLISGGNEQSTLLTTIVSLNPIHVHFDADEQAFLKYTSLQNSGKLASLRDAKLPVFVRLGDEQNYPHRGHLDFLDNRLDRKTATIRGRAILPNPDLKLTPGLFAKVRIPGSGQHEAVLVPDSAIGTDQAEKFVLVVDKDQTIRRQKIELGKRTKGLRIVREGLTGNEQIVLRGLQRAAPGSVVEPSFEATVAADDGLPDSADPLPRSEWLPSYVKKPSPINATSAHDRSRAAGGPMRSPAMLDSMEVTP